MQCQEECMHTIIPLHNYYLACFLQSNAYESCDTCCSKVEEEEVDPEQARKDMERLQLIKQRRCEVLPCCLRKDALLLWIVTFPPCLNW